MITAPQVRVIDHDGSQAGVMSIRQALSFAEERGLDLVEVASNAHPPVCKVVDYGKFRYERTRRARTARKKQHTIDVKEVRLRPKIDDHDYDFKCKNARKFLEGRDKVKVTVLFRGRERTHAERGRALLDKFSADLADVGIVEQQAQLDGRSAMMVMVLAPKPIS